MSSAYEFKQTIYDYLEGLPEVVQTRLYQSPATCLAIFRLLPRMAKFFIMSMIFNDQPIPARDLNYWIKPYARKHQLEALAKLKGLHVLREESGGLVTLNPIFRKQLRSALTGGASNNAFGVPCATEDKHKVGIPFLDEHARTKWENILHFMVGTPDTEVPNDGVLSLLRHGGLMEGGPRAKDMRISNKGFQFLLQDVNTQIWTLLLQYLRMAESLNMDPVDVLNFVFMLGSLELGRDYSLAVLSETQINMLDDLRDYGLVYQRKSSSRRFYPTRLATTLTSDGVGLRQPAAVLDQVTQAAAGGAGVNGGAESGAGAAGGAGGAATDATGEPAANDSGFVIIETNFKLYAYTSSPLQIAVLHLFTHLKARFANMIMGQLTRESVRRALYNGISADQIILYLSTHVHPQMVKMAEAKGLSTVLPPTVVDQIRLWQLEMDRIRTTEGYLYTDFRDYEEYASLSRYATELGVVVWNNSQLKKFFVTKEGNSQVIEYANGRLRKKKA